MTDALLKRLTASATGAFDLHRSHYRKDCADALAEIERLRSGVYQSVLNLKMLYMDAGLGTKKGLGGSCRFERRDQSPRSACDCSSAENGHEMSRPISYAATALQDKLFERGIIITGLDELAAFTVRRFLEDAKDEGRFDNAAIDKLLADLS